MKNFYLVKFFLFIYLLKGTTEVFGQSHCTEVDAPTNLIVNGNFETNTNGWQTDFGSLGKFSNYEVCGFSYCAFTSNETTSRAWQDIPNIIAGTPLSFKGYLGGLPEALACNPQVKLLFYDASSNLLGSISEAITTNVGIAPYKPGLHTINTISPANTSFARIEVVGSCNIIKMDAFVLYINNSLLPLHLASFTGSSEGHYNKLVWSTQNEINIDQFEIENSEDGLSFRNIGIVTTTSNTLPTNHYELKDFNIINPKTYYRLKILEKNNTIRYSNIILINRAEATSSISVKSFPNPFTNTISISWNHPNNYAVTLQIRNQHGVIVHSQKRNATKGLNFITLNNLNDLPSGLYYLEIESNKKRIGSQKILKK